MTPEEFVRCFRREKDELLRRYSDPASEVCVAARLARAGGAADPAEAIREVLDTVLTDALYTVLLALDGSASLGGVQQSYRVLDEGGREVCNGDGTVEALAYDHFHHSGG